MAYKSRRNPDVSARMVLLAEQLSEAAHALSVMASELRQTHETAREEKHGD